MPLQSYLAQFNFKLAALCQWAKKIIITIIIIVIKIMEILATNINGDFTETTYLFQQLPVAFKKGN